MATVEGSRNQVIVSWEQEVEDPRATKTRFYRYQISATRYLSLKASKSSAPLKYLPELYAGYPEARGSSFDTVEDILETDGGYPVWSANQPAKSGGAGYAFKRYLTNPKVSVGDDLFRRVFLPVVTGYETLLVAGLITKTDSQPAFSDTNFSFPEPFTKVSNKKYVSATYRDVRLDPLQHCDYLFEYKYITALIDQTTPGILSAEDALSSLDTLSTDIPESFKTQIQTRITNLSSQDSFLGYTPTEEISAPYLIFDIDSDNLEEARKQAITLIEAIKDLVCEYRGPNKPLKKHKISLGIVFSGSKGFHVYVPVGVQAPELPAFFKKIATVIKYRYSLNCLDTKIYDPERVIRVPGTVNHKSGELCCVISEKLLRSSVEDILTYSRRLKAYYQAQGDDPQGNHRRPKLYHLPNILHNCLKFPIFISRLCMTKISPYKEEFMMGDKVLTKFRPLDTQAWLQMSTDLDVGINRWSPPPAISLSVAANHTKKSTRGEETVMRYPTQQITDFFSTERTLNRSMTFREALNFVKTVDFRPLFGLPTNNRSFTCLYHEDHNPSAIVIQPSVETPVYLYRCMANSAEHPYKTIIDLTIDYYRFLGEEIDVKTAVRRICYALGIEVREGQNSVAAQEIREMLEDVIVAVRRQGRYDTYRDLNITRHIYSLGLQLAEHYDVSPQGFYFGVAIRELCKKTGYTDVSRIAQAVNLCHCLGLIRKVDPDEVPAWYRNNVVINGLRQALGTEINYFQLTADWDADEINRRYNLWISAGNRKDTCTLQNLEAVFGLENLPAYEPAALIDVYNSFKNNPKVPEAKKTAYLAFIQRVIDYRREHSAEQTEARLRRAASQYQLNRGDTSRTITGNFEVCVILHNRRECLIARYLRYRGYEYSPLIFFGDMLEMPCQRVA